MLAYRWLEISGIYLEYTSTLAGAVSLQRVAIVAGRGAIEGTFVAGSEI